MAAKRITQERLRHLLTYYPHIGWFVHNKRPLKDFTALKHYRQWSFAFAGCRAGTLNKQGYRRIALDGKSYGEGPLAWFYTHGQWPDQIDHINHVRDDNRLTNLRPVSHDENHRNRSLQRTSRSGMCGVSPDRNSKKWWARITHDNITYDLGVFDDFFEAACARKSAEIRFGFHPNHGQRR